jgi:hypothetical protein
MQHAKSRSRRRQPLSGRLSSASGRSTSKCTLYSSIARQNYSLPSIWTALTFTGIWEGVVGQKRGHGETDMGARLSRYALQRLVCIFPCLFYDHQAKSACATAPLRGCKPSGVESNITGDSYILFIIYQSKALDSSLKSLIPRYTFNCVTFNIAGRSY